VAAERQEPPGLEANLQRMVVIALTLLVTVGRGQASAWGCEGHQAVAIIAERLLGPRALPAVQALLGASPVDPVLRRGCQPVPVDPLADAATWADDERAADPATAAWHFVNLPRSLSSATANPAPYCAGGQCVIDAITTQFHTLTTSGDRAKKANALRFIIHFVGDIHQPLHVITNGDRGGNCFPVAYFGRPPEVDARSGFSPNLHGVWDSSMIARLMNARGLADARALTDYVIAQGGLPQTVTARAPTASSVTSWAREAHALARSVAYGRLPIPAPIEPAAVTLTSCNDNHNVAHRLLALNERLADPYELAAETVIVAQLRLAGTRLAAALKSAFP
jgi:hypothetical protein